MPNIELGMGPIIFIILALNVVVDIKTGCSKQVLDKCDSEGINSAK